MPISNEEAFQKASFLKAFWWLLWASSIILLELYYRDLSGERVKISQGQYWFFAIAVLSTLALLYSLKELLLKIFVSNKIFAFGICFLFIALGLSAGFGANAAYGLRLLVILFLTSFSFVILGVASFQMLAANKLVPLLFVSMFCAMGACLLNLSGPITLAGAGFENFLLEPRSRWAFLFIEANGLGGMIALGITVTLYQTQVVKAVVLKYGLTLLLLPIFFFVFWKTNSRGSLLWIMVTLLFYLGLWVRNLFVAFGNHYLKRLLVPVLILCSATGIILLTIYRQDLVIYFRLNQADLTTGRMEIWLMYLEQFKNHPLLGFGFGASDQIMADYVVKGKYFIAGPLNVFFGILGETGLLGFSGMLFLWVGAILKAWQVVKHKLYSQDNDFHYAFFLMVILISLAAHQNGEWQVLRITPFNFLFFFLVSAAWTLREQSKSLSTKKFS